MAPLCSWPAVVVSTSVIAGLVSDARHARLVDTLGSDLDALQHLRLWVIPLSPFIQADNGVGLRFVGLMTFALAAVALLNWRARQQ